MKNNSWKDSNLLSKFTEKENYDYDRLSDDILFDELDDSITNVAFHRFASNLKKPVIVVHKTEGIYQENNKFLPGWHHLVHAGVSLKGIAMYNIPEGMENEDPYNQDLSNGLKGHGWGLYIESEGHKYKKIKIVPINKNGLKDAVNHLGRKFTDYLIDKDRNWHRVFLLSFNPEDFDKLYSDFKKKEAENSTIKEPMEDTEDILEIINTADDIIKRIENDKLKDKYLIGTTKKTKEYAKTNWIEKGYPCAKREGFAMYGAKAKSITTHQALKGIETCLDIDIEIIDGKDTLVLGFYSGADLL